MKRVLQVLLFVAVVYMPGLTQAQTPLPYTTGFENGDNTGWTFVNSNTNAWCTGTAAHNGGSYGMYISNNGGADNAYSVNATQFSYAYRTMSIAESGQYIVSFDWKARGEDNYDYLRAWLAPATAQLVAGHDPWGSTWTYDNRDSVPDGWIDLGGRMNGTSTWQNSVTVFNLTAGSYRLVFMWANDYSDGNQPPAAIDNIYFNRYTCPAPTDIRVGGISATGATVAWTRGGSENAWELTIGNDVYYPADTFYTVNNLDIYTPYEARVRAVCGSGDTSLAACVPFRTSCLPISQLPYIQDFEEAAIGSVVSPAFVDCMYRLNNATANYGYPVVQEGNNNHTAGGANGLYWYATPGDYQIMSLPPVDTAIHPVSTLQLGFWARSVSNGWSRSFQVGVMSDPYDAASFQQVATINTSSNSTWQEYTIFFNGYTGQGRYVAIRMNSTGGACLDDIKLDVIPACSPVDTHHVVATASSAHIDWSYDHTYDHLYGNGPGSYVVGYWNASSGIASPTVDTVMDNELTLTGLTANTAYAVSITPVCGDGYGPAYTFNFTTQAVADPCPAPAVFVHQDDIADDIVVSWIPGYQESSWNLDYREAGDSTWTAILTGTTQNSHTVQLNSLQPNTGYLFRVTANCGNTGTSAMAGFTTPCGLFPVPFNEGFESFPVTAATPLPDCWMKHTNQTTQYPKASSSYHHSGTKSMYMASTASTYCYMVLPRMALPVDSTMVSFWLYKTDSTALHNIKVGVMTNPDDVSTFVEVASVAPSSVGTWEVFEIPLDSYTGTGRFIALLSPDGVKSQPYLDDLLVTSISQCMRVTNVNVTDITNNSATVKWTGNGYNVFEVEYGPSGFALGNGTRIQAVWVDSVVLTNLLANTEYDVYVRAFCNPDYSAWSVNVPFVTKCDMIGVPYMQDFEGALVGSFQSSSFVDCMFRRHNGLMPGEHYPYVGGSECNHTAGGERGLIWACSISSNPDAYQFVTLPQLDTMLYPVNTVEMSFWARGEDIFDNPVVDVGVLESPDDISSFQSVQTVHITSGTDWEEYRVSLDSYNGHGSYVAIRNHYQAPNWWAYIDDILLEEIPACPRVENLTVTQILSTSATVTWTDTSTTNLSWYVEYDTTEFTPGTGHATPIFVTNTSCAITGLDSGRVYHVYVYPECGDVVASRHKTFRTIEGTLDTVPYRCGFEAPGKNGWYFVNGDQTNQWIVGNAVSNGGSRSMYISNDNGVHNTYTFNVGSDVYAVKSLLIETPGVYYISYDWRARGTRYMHNDYLRVFLVPSSVEFTAGDRSGIALNGAPAGWIALDGSTALCWNPLWQTHDELFTVTTPSIYNLVFFWHNNGFDGELPPAAIDNVQVGLYTCPKPQNVTVDTVTNESVTLHWGFGGSEIAWDVTVNGATTVVEATHATVTGLAENTNYTAKVRAICGEGDTSLAATVTFNTQMCANPRIVSTGDPNLTASASDYVPVNNDFNYSISEIIIDSAEIGGITEFSAISLFFNDTTVMTRKNSVDIWLQPTDKSFFSNINDIILLDTTIAVKVYSGPLNCTYGWNDFEFTTNYLYNGIGNLLLIFDDNSAGCEVYNYVCRFRTMATSGFKTKTIYRSYDIDVNDIGNYTGSRMYYQWRPVMKLISCNPSCTMPVIDDASDITRYSATLNWDGAATDYEVTYKAVSVGTWSVATMVSGFSHELSNLEPGTTYQYRVRSACDTVDGEYSDWAVGAFTTLPPPCYPPTGLVAAPGYVNASFEWEPGSVEPQWEVHVWNSSTNISRTADSHPFVVNGLAQNTQYYAAVKALCGSNNESEYSDTIQFTTNSCSVPTDVAVSEVGSTKAVVTWSGNASKYDISYGERGFGEGQGNTVIGVTGNRYTISGLVPEMPYDVYVRSYCAAGVPSVWSDRVEFTTSNVAVADVGGGMNVTIYPNPTTGVTTISLSGVSGEVAIAVIDLSGRTVKSCSVVCDGDCSKTVTVDDLAAGIYFVRITANGTNAVKKLIVKQRR